MKNYSATQPLYRPQSVRRESHTITAQSHFVVPFWCAAFAGAITTMLAWRLGAEWDSLFVGAVIGGLAFGAVLFAVFKFGGQLEMVFGDLNGDGVIGEPVEYRTSFDIGLPAIGEHVPQRLMDSFHLHPDQVAEQFRMALDDDAAPGNHGVLALERSGLRRKTEWEPFLDRLKLHELVVLDQDNHHQLTEKGRIFMSNWLRVHVARTHEHVID